MTVSCRPRKASGSRQSSLLRSDLRHLDGGMRAGSLADRISRRSWCLILALAFCVHNSEEWLLAPQARRGPVLDALFQLSLEIRAWVTQPFTSVGWSGLLLSTTTEAHRSGSHVVRYSCCPGT